MGRAEAVETTPTRHASAAGEIYGRYSRIVGLPEGTLQRVVTLRTALQEMPPHLCRGLRRYEIQQFRDGRFESRLVSVSPLPAAFGERFQQCWWVSGDVRNVAGIPYKTAVSKFEDFVSEYVEPVRP
jgi:hypothetical protein